MIQDHLPSQNKQDKSFLLFTTNLGSNKTSNEVELQNFKAASRSRPQNTRLMSMIIQFVEQNNKY